MEAKLLATTGTLTFRFTYDLEGAEVRPGGYSGRYEYLPETLKFKLKALSGNGKCPDYAELEIEGVTLHGRKIKKDGTPGQVETTEQFWSFKGRPEWVTEIINQAKAKLRQEGGFK